MKKIILSGLFAGLIIFLASQVVGRIFGVIFPAINAEYQNPNLFRPFTDPLMLLFFLHPFLVGIILAWFWNKITLQCCPGQENTFRKGIKGGVKFGIAYWIIATIPGMFATYSSMPYSLAIVSSWLVSSLVSAVLAGIVFAKIDRKSKA